MFLKHAMCAALLALLSLSFLAACTTSQATSLVSAPTALAGGKAPTMAQAASICQTSQLTLTYDSSQAAVGNRADQFRFQNISHSMCTLFGYPHIQVLSADYQLSSTQAAQETSGYLYAPVTLKVVSLAPGAKAYFVVEWAVGACEPNSIDTLLQVTSPGDSNALTTSASDSPDGGIDACQGYVNALSVSPVTSTAPLYQ
jgi:hypothetical protein